MKKRVNFARFAFEIQGVSVQCAWDPTDEHLAVWIKRHHRTFRLTKQQIFGAAMTGGPIVEQPARRKPRKRKPDATSPTDPAQLG